MSILTLTNITTQYPLQKENLQVNTYDVTLFDYNVYSELNNLSNYTASKTYTFGPDVSNVYILGGTTNGSNTLANSLSSNISNINSLGNSIFSVGCYCASWNGKMWIAGGEGDINTLAYSYDGTNWYGLGNIIFTNKVNNLEWSNSQSIWIGVGSGANSIGYSYNGIDWFGLGENIFTNGLSVRMNETIWLAGGIGTSTLAYSYDAINWTSLGTTIIDSCYSLFWNGSKWLAAGGDNTSNNTLAYSTDGINWIVSQKIMNTVRSISWDGNKWVICGYGSTSSIYYSQNLTNWISTNVITSGNLNSIFFDGSKFISVGDDLSNKIFTSSDGITWTSISIGNTILNSYSFISFNYRRQCSVLFNSNSNKIIMGCGDLTNTLFKSSDGITWSEINNTNFFTKCNSIDYNGSLWVAGGTGDNTLVYSYDSINWINFGKSIINIEIYDIYYDNFMWLACGSGTNGTIAYSYDGISWSHVPNSLTIMSTPRKIYSNNNIKFITGSDISNNVISTSTNGINWTSINWNNVKDSSGNVIIQNNRLTYVRDIKWDGTKYVVVGESNTSNLNIIISYDGINWTLIDTNISTIGAFTTFSSITYNNNIWIGTGKASIQSYTIAYSSNLYNWTVSQSSVFTDTCLNVKYNDNNNWTACGTGRNILAKSTDNGVTWVGINNPNNITDYQLIQGGYTLSDFQNEGYTITQLIILGFKDTDIKNIGYTATQFKTAGYTATQLKTAGYTATELKTAGYTSSELKVIGFIANELKTAGYSATEMKTALFTAIELKNAGYTATEMKSADYTALELKTVGYNANELKTASFTATEMKAALYSVTELNSVGFTALEMKIAGFTSSQLKNIGYTALELKSALYPDSEILFLDYTSSELKQAGYTIIKLFQSGYSITSIVQAGFTAKELFDSNISSTSIGSTIYTAQELRLAGYTARNLLDATFSHLSVANAGYEVSILRTTDRVNFTPLILKNAGYTLAQLRHSSVIPALTVAQLLSASYPINDVRVSNFTTLTIIRRDASNIYNDSDIISNGGYTVSELRIGGIIANQLINNFTPNQLRIGGYTSTQILLSGYPASTLRTSIDPIYTILDLKNAEYSPLSLKNGGYSDSSILSISFEANLLKDAGYTASELRINNYTVQQLKNNNIYTTNEILNAGFPSIILFGIYSASELKSANYSVESLLNAGYSIVDILISNYSANELRQNGFTISQLKPYYTALDIRNGGYSDNLILQASFTISQLKLAGYNPTNLKPYYTLVDLKNNNLYTTQEILAAKYSVLNIKSVGYTVEEAKSFYTISELRTNNIYTTNEILIGGYSVSELKIHNFTATQLRQNGYIVNDLLNIYSDVEILQAKYPASSLKNNFLASQLFQYGYTIAELIQGGYSTSEILSAGYSSTQLREQGFTVLQLKLNNFTVSQIRNSQYPDSEILQAGFTVAELLTAFSYTAIQLRESNYQPTELKNNGFTDQIILSAGFTALELKNAGYTLTQLKDKNYTPLQLKNALFPNNDIINAGFNILELKDASYFPDDLTNIYTDDEILSVGYSSNILKLSGYTAQKLKDANYSISSLKSANYLDLEILSVGFKAIDLKTEGLYNATQLKSASYTATQLREAFFTIDKLIEAEYTDYEILNAGYFASQLKEEGYTGTQLKDVGYTAKQLKIGGYDDSEILSLNYDSTDLIVSGYTSSELQAAGYGAEQILTGLISFTEVLSQPPILKNVVISSGSVLVYFDVIDEDSNKIFGFKYSIDETTYLWASETQSPITINGLTNGTNYIIRLKSVNSSGDSLPSSNYLTVTPLDIPDAPTITDIIQLDKSIEVNFIDGNNNGSFITNYYYSIDISNIVYNECFPIDNKFIISNLDNGIIYNVRIKSKNELGLSNASISRESTPLSIPDPPTITSIIGGDKQLGIYFTSGNNNGSQILYFKYSFDGEIYYFAEQNVSPIIIKNLINDTEYNVSLINANIVGESIASNIVSQNTIEIPIKPIIIEITPYDTTSFLVTLLNDTYDEKYSYFYSIDNSPYQEIKIIIDENILITNLQEGMSYNITIKAYNGLHYSQESNSYIANLYSPLPIPDITNVTPGDKSAIINYITNNVNMSSVNYYEYIINNDISNVYVIPYNNTNNLTIYGLINDVKTTIQMRSVSNISKSNFSLPSKEFTPFGQPFTPVINTIIPGNGLVYVYLNDVSNNGSQITSYEYFDGSKYNVVQGTESPLLITNLTNRTNFNISLISKNKAGNSLLSDVFSVIPGTPTPPVINNVIDGNRTLTVYFTASNSNGFNITQYQYRLNNSTTTVRITTLTSPFTISNLINGTPYSISIVSTNANGISLDSNTISNLIPAGIPLTMVAPIVTPVSGNSQSSIATLQFIPPNPNGSDIIGYKYKINGLSQEFNIDSLTSPVTISGLPSNSNYQISMSAINSVGRSIYSPNSTNVIFKNGPPDRIIISSVVASLQTLIVNFSQPNLNNGVLQKYTYSLNGGSYIDYPNINLPMIINGIMPNTNYTVQVKAVNDIGESTESVLTSPVRFTYLAPNPPVITSIIGLDKTLSINFTPSVVRGAPVTRYYYSFDGIDLFQAYGQLTSPILITNLTNDVFYNVRLYADSDADISTSSNIIRSSPIFRLPSQPSITKVTPLNSSAQVNFNPPSSLNGTAIIDYVYSLNNSENYTRIFSTSSPFIINELINDISYNIRIAVLSDNGLSPYSQTSVFTPIYYVPSKPIITTVSTTINKTGENLNTATINFNLSEPNGGTISRYLYTLNNGDTLINANSINTSSTTGRFQLLFLATNVPYYLRLVAENENGQSELSSTTTFAFIYTAPSSPVIGTITTTKDRATIPFSLGSANNGTITNVYYSINNDNTYIPINRITSPIILTDLSSNIPFSITLKSENELGISSSSTSKSFTCIHTVPSPPVIGIFANTKDTVTFTLTLGSANGGVINNLYYSLDGENTYIPINRTNSPVVITGLTSNIVNTITLKNSNELGLSNSSASRSFTCVYTVPSPPTIGNITSTKDTATVPFTLGSANGGIIDKVYYSLNGQDYVDANKITSPIIITGLTSNVVNTLTLKTSNELGLSNSSASRSFTCVYTVPSPPTIGNITSTKDTATVPFTLGSANGGIIDKVYYSLNGQDYVDANKITSPIILTDLSSNITNTITLQTRNELGLSNASASRSFTCVYTVPSPPTIGLVRINKYKVNISFTTSSSNGGTISNYNYSIDDGITYTPINSLLSPFSIDISVNTLITLTMKAENELGLSAQSNVKSFTSIYTSPDSPTVLNLITDISGVNVIFVPGSSNSGTISKYEYTLDDGTTIIDTGSLSNLFRIDLPNGTYNIQIRSINELGESQWSQPKSFSIP